jgi:hypothetical protein
MGIILNYNCAILFRKQRNMSESNLTSLAIALNGININSSKEKSPVDMLYHFGISTLETDFPAIFGDIQVHHSNY